MKPELWLLAALWFFLAWPFLWPWKWKSHIPPKCLLTFSELHGIISQKIELLMLLITTVVRTSNPTKLERVLCLCECKLCFQIKCWFIHSKM
jgi:hypothetical protein